MHFWYIMGHRSQELCVYLWLPKIMVCWWRPPDSSFDLLCSQGAQEWPWPLTYNLQNLIGSSESESGRLCKVEGNPLKYSWHVALPIMDPTELQTPEGWTTWKHDASCPQFFDVETLWEFTSLGQTWCLTNRSIYLHK